MLHVGHDKWRLCFVNPCSCYLQRTDGSYALGCTDNYYKTIFISKYLPIKKLRHVLVHELAHAFMFSKNIIMDEFDEELLCCFTERWADDILILSREILMNVLSLA